MKDPGKDVVDGPGVEDDGPVLVEALPRRRRCTAVALVVLVGAAQHRWVVHRPQAPGVVGARPPPTVSGHFTKHQPIHFVKSAGRSLGRRPPLT